MSQTEQVTVEVQAHIDDYVNNMKRATAFMKSATTVQNKAMNSLNQALNSTVGGYQKSSVASNQYAQSIQGTANTVDTNSRMYQQAEYRLEGMTRQTLNASNASGSFSTGMKSMGSSLQSFGGYIKNAGNSLTNFVPGLKNVGVVAGVTAAATSEAMNIIGNTVERTVKRLDTLSSAPKIWQAMGAGADESSKAIKYLADSLDGLNAPLDDAVGATTQFMTVIGQNNDVSKQGVNYASQLARAWTVAGLASGKSSAVVKSGMTQFIQLLGNATAAGQEFNTLRELIPAQLEDLSEHMLGAGKSSRDLQQALKDGTVTTQDLEDAFIELSSADGKWAKLAQENSLTVQAQWQNMQSKFANLFAAIITGTTDPNAQGIIWSENFAASMKKVSDNIRDLTPKIVEFTEGFKEGFGEDFGEAVERLKDLIEPFTTVSEKLDAINGDDIRDKGKAIGEMVVQFIQLALGLQTLGTVVGVVGTVMKAIGELTTGFKAVSTLLFGGEAGAGLLGGLGELGGVIGGLSTPVLIVVGAISALVLGFIAWLTQTDAGKEFLKDAWEQIQVAISDVSSKLGDIWNDLKQTFGELGQSIVDVLNSMGFNFEDFQQVVDTVMTALGQTIVSIITLVIQEFGDVAETISGAVQIISGVIETLIGVFDLFKGAFDIVMGLVTGDTNQMVKGFNEFKTGGETAVKGVKRVFKGLGDFFGGILDAIVGPIQSMINWFGKLGSSADTAKSKAKSASSSSRSAPIPQSSDRMATPQLKTFAMSNNALEPAINTMSRGLSGGFGSLNTSISRTINSVRQATSNLPKPTLRTLQPMEVYDSGLPTSVQRTQPAEFVLKMGTETFRGFANDISGSQGQAIKLSKRI